MKHSPSQKANSHSANQEIPQFMEPAGLFLCSQSPLLVPILILWIYICTKFLFCFWLLSVNKIRKCKWQGVPNETLASYKEHHQNQKLSHDSDIGTWKLKEVKRPLKLIKLN